MPPISLASAEPVKKTRKPMSEETKKAAAAKRAATKAKKAAAAAAGATDAESVADEITDFSPFEYKDKNFVKNARGDVMTESLEWVGHWDGKKLDKKAPKPADLEI
jgi:hypothetical protein